MIDIWLGDKFYVIQIGNGMIGLSLITAENISFDTRPDESFIDIVQFKNRFNSIFNNIIVP